MGRRTRREWICSPSPSAVGWAQMVNLSQGLVSFSHEAEISEVISAVCVYIRRGYPVSTAMRFGVADVFDSDICCLHFALTSMDFGYA